MSAAKSTTSHDEIREWVEERGGIPARVRGTGVNEDPGMLRIDFPEVNADSSLEQISWDEWLEKFEGNHLAFLHQDRTADGQLSRFNKIVARDTVERRSHGESHASAHHRRKP